jgi:hypothetical protein
MIRPLAIMAFYSGLALAASPGSSAPVVVELFTSEACSNCPPADRIMERLAGNPNVIILSEHVGYLDNQGWKDPFSSPLFTTRQLDYAAALRRTNVVTPQVIINGEKELSGTDFPSLSEGTLASRTPRVPVTLKWVRDAGCNRKNPCTNVALTVGTLPKTGHKSNVLLVIAENDLESTVLGGPNAGNKLRHMGVVRSMMQLAEVDPAKPGEYSAEAHLNLRPEWVRSNLKIVLLVQDRENHRILGAASLGVPESRR